MEYFDTTYTVQITKDVVYNTNPTTIPGYLLNIYKPLLYAYDGPSWTAGQAAPVTNRPTIIWAHGGSFQYGSKDNPGEGYAYQFAQRGYNAIAIDYRKPLPYSYGVNETMAICDMRAAIRWAKANAAPHNIDTTKIIAGGDSAGGFAAIQAAISNTEQANGNNGTMGAGSRPAAVVALWAPVTSKPGWLQTDAIQVANITAGLIDVFAGVQGKLDTPVPPAEMRALWNQIVALRGTGKAFYTELANALHNQMNRSQLGVNDYREGFFEDAFRGVLMYLGTKLSLI